MKLLLNFGWQSWRNQEGAAKTKRTRKVPNDDRADWRETWALFPGDVDVPCVWKQR